MSNGEVFIPGKLKYVYYDRLNKYGKWSIQVYPTPSGLEVVNQLIKEGVKNELKKDEDGYFINFHRMPEMVDRKGHRFTLKPPTIIDNDGRLIQTAIGNGSTGIVKIETYGGKSPIGSSYKAARFAGVKITDLIPYNPEESNDKYEVRNVSGLKEQPAPKDTW
jgi:hypothetical protein